MSQRPSTPTCPPRERAAGTPRRALAAGLAGGLLLAAGLGPPAARAGAPGEAAPAIGVEEIRPGMTGYGLSVFRGSEPERFAVEVLGIMRNVQPGSSFILARLGGQNLEETGVVAGMSGSPVYLDGRLAGAVAFAWPFSRGAVGGITPIAEMRALLPSPGGSAAAAGGPALRPRGSSPFALPPLDLARRLAGEMAADLAGRALAALAPPGRDGARPGLAWSAAGFGAGTRELLARELGAVGLAGEGGTAPADLHPGSAIAAVLVDGDLRLAAFGTVTDRVGEEILAFGHPVLGLGTVEVPMASAEVLAVLSSQYSSFKISGHGPVVGAFELDRQPGMRGRLGLRARTIPMAVTVAGDAPRRFALALADVPSLTPVLVAIGALGCLEAAGQVGGPQGLDLDVRFAISGGRRLAGRQSFEGPQGPGQAAGYLLSLASFLVANDFEEVDLEAVEVDLAQAPEPRTARLVAAHASASLVRPGERVTLYLDLVGHRSEPFRRTVELVLPSSLPAGRYSLLAGDGASMDTARLAIERASPLSFPQALDLLGSLHSRRQLVVLGVFAEPGLAVAGEVLPQLPASLRSVWGAAASGTAEPLRLAIAQRHIEELPVPLAGAVRVDLRVERREPVAAAPEAKAPRALPAAPGPAAAPPAARKEPAPR